MLSVQVEEKGVDGGGGRILRITYEKTSVASLHSWATASVVLIGFPITFLLDMNRTCCHRDAPIQFA
jgi:hypothetical protein